MKIGTFTATYLVKGPAELAFSFPDIPAGASFRSGLLGLGSPSLIAGIAKVVYPVITLVFSYNADITEREKRAFHLVPNQPPQDLPTGAIYCCTLYEPAQREGQAPQPLFVYEVPPVRD